MPASLSENMVCGTKSCNLSSIPVAPTRNSSLSISSTLSFYMLSVFMGQVLQANHRDLRPVLVIQLVFVLTSSKYFCLFDSIFSMFVSAPLTNTQMDDSVLTTTVIRLRSESNSTSFSSSNVFLFLPYSTIVILFQVEMNLKPTLAAAFSKAT